MSSKRYVCGLGPETVEPGTCAHDMLAVPIATVLEHGRTTAGELQTIVSLEREKAFNFWKLRDYPSALATFLPPTKEQIMCEKIVQVIGDFVYELVL